MLAQRGADLTREARKAAEAKQTREAKSAAPATQRKRKLNFNEKHALETLPKTIAALHDEARALQRRLDDPALFARDRSAFDQALTRSAKCRQNWTRPRTAGWSWKSCARN